MLLLAALWSLLGSTQAFAAPGQVLWHQKISDTEGGFSRVLDDGGFFGISVTAVGDLDRDGVGDLAVGARADGDGGWNRGAVWVLSMDGVATFVPALQPAFQVRLALLLAVPALGILRRRSQARRMRPV